MTTSTHSSDHSTKDNNKQQRTLLFSFIIITGFMLIEAIGGWLTGSLALLSDAGHMLSDAVALGATLLAFKIGEKAATQKKTFGYRRFEILVAGVNGATLVIISLMIIYEAFLRFWDPEPIASKEMLIIAAIGMFINILVAWLLHRGGAEHGHSHTPTEHSHAHNPAHNHAHNHSHAHSHDNHQHAIQTNEGTLKSTQPTAANQPQKNLNMHSAYLHVLGDLLGSVAAIIAALAMIYFDWWWADPVASLIVSILILLSGYRVVRDSVHILMEGTPDNMSLVTIETQLLKHTQVQAVHDLHVWSITSGLHALSCHVVVDGEMSIEQSGTLIHELETKLQTLGISHATIQVESLHCPTDYGDSLVCDLAEHGQINTAHIGHSH